MVLGRTELAAHLKGVVFASNYFEKFFQVRPGMYKCWLVFLATNLLAGALLGHFIHVLLSLCHGHLPTWLVLHTSAALSLLECDVICVMCRDHIQTNRVSEWYYVYTSHPTTIKFHLIQMAQFIWIGFVFCFF